MVAEGRDSRGDARPESRDGESRDGGPRPPRRTRQAGGRIVTFGTLPAGTGTRRAWSPVAPDFDPAAMRTEPAPADDVDDVDDVDDPLMAPTPVPGSAPPSWSDGYARAEPVEPVEPPTYPPAAYPATPAGGWDRRGAPPGYADPPGYPDLPDHPHADERYPADAGRAFPPAGREEPRYPGRSPVRDGPGGPRGAGGRAPASLDEVSFTGQQSAVMDAPPRRSRVPREPGPRYEEPGPSRPVDEWGDRSDAYRGFPAGPDDRPGFLDDGPDGPPGDHPDRPVRRPRRRRNPLISAFQAALVAVILVIGVSLGRTLALPGDAGNLSRVADWGRANHLSFIVDRVDRVR